MEDEEHWDEQWRAFLRNRPNFVSHVLGQGKNGQVVLALASSFCRCEGPRWERGMSRAIMRWLWLPWQIRRDLLLQYCEWYEREGIDEPD